MSKEILRQIKKEFDANGIEIPYPRIHLVPDKKLEERIDRLADVMTKRQAEHEHSYEIGDQKCSASIGTHDAREPPDITNSWAYPDPCENETNTV